MAAKSRARAFQNGFVQNPSNKYSTLSFELLSRRDAFQSTFLSSPSEIEFNLFSFFKLPIAHQCAYFYTYSDDDPVYRSA